MQAAAAACAAAAGPGSRSRERQRKGEEAAVPRGSAGRPWLLSRGCAQETSRKRRNWRRRVSKTSAVMRRSGRRGHGEVEAGGRGGGSWVGGKESQYGKRD